MDYVYNNSEFSKYHITVSGRYYTSVICDDNNVTYIGSPNRFTFDDIVSRAGYYHFNTDIPILKDCIVLTFIENHGIDGNKNIIDEDCEFDTPCSMSPKVMDYMEKSNK